ncbi:hypothetical protein [Luteimonas sp. e5]
MPALALAGSAHAQQGSRNAEGYRQPIRLHVAMTASRAGVARGCGHFELATILERKMRSHVASIERQHEFRMPSGEVDEIFSKQVERSEAGIAKLAPFERQLKCQASEAHQEMELREARQEARRRQRP